MRIVFMGTPDFAVPALQKLVENFSVVAVFTQPDRPKGRGKKVQPPPVKVAAEQLNIPIYQPENIKSESSYQILEDLSPDVIIVAAYGQLLPQRILKLPLYGCINIHASLLPKYRGAAPIHWAVINGEKKTGITTMLMNEGLDTGDILLQQDLTISSEDTVGSIHDKLAIIGGDLIVETVKLLKENKIIPQKQNHKVATYAKMIDKQIERIDWNLTAKEIFNKVRGLNPWPGAYTSINGKRIKIWKVTLEDDTTIATPGKILDIIPEKGLKVATGKGIVIIDELQPEGKKKMSASAFLRGHSLNKGEILGE